MRSSVLLAQFIDQTTEVGWQRRGFETKVLLQPLTHFVADRPASIVVDVAVVRDSAVEFHFAALSVRPHEALSRRVGKCFARHGTIARVSYA
jgi:hypothetical protein